jgi:methylglutamate dehydrogenase subunit C
MTAFRRLPTGGRIDRAKPLAFQYNGKSATGFEGDSIASALLTNNHLIIGRSFKYHRPRGFLSAGLEEPNGLFTLGEGAETVPNTIGTTTMLKAGMKVKSQNAWPSPTFDLMAINSAVVYRRLLLQNL